MTQRYTWNCHGATGDPGPTFPDQVEAEAWLTEEWPSLAEAGVDSVTLLEGERVVYGPMSLSPDG